MAKGSIIPNGRSSEIKLLRSQKKAIETKLKANPNNTKAQKRLKRIEQELAVLESRGFY